MQASLKLFLNVKTTRRQVLIYHMEQVVPWNALVDLIALYCPEGSTVRLPFSLLTMLRVHFVQLWFTMYDPGMEEAFFDVPLYREFAHPEEFGPLLYESTNLRIRHLLERRKLAQQILGVVNDLLIQRGLLIKTGTLIDASLIAIPSSTKIIDHKRVPEVHSIKKSELMHFGGKDHIGTDAESGLVHIVRGTSGNLGEVVKGDTLLEGEVTHEFENAGYQRIAIRPDAKASVTWHVAMLLGTRRTLKKKNAVAAMIDKFEMIKAGSWAEHSFRVIKRQYGYMKVRFRGFKKSTAQLVTQFELSNFWMVRGKLMSAQG
jgi:IS5 family transposase